MKMSVLLSAVLCTTFMFLNFAQADGCQQLSNDFQACNADSTCKIVSIASCNAIPYHSTGGIGGPDTDDDAAVNANNQQFCGPLNIYQCQFFSSQCNWTVTGNFCVDQ